MTIQRRAELPDQVALLIGEPEAISYEELQRTIGHILHGEEWQTREIPKIMAKAGAWTQDHLPLSEDPFIKAWMIDFADDHYELDISRARAPWLAARASSTPRASNYARSPA